MQRGVLPALGQLGVTGRALAPLPAPDAAPHVEVRLLPDNRTPPGHDFCVMDDILPDMRLALGPARRTGAEQTAPLLPLPASLRRLRVAGAVPP